MPRYDDRHGSTRLYVGHLSSRTRSRDLESIFARYGRIRDVDMKRDYAFVEFSDPRDADDARYRLDGKDVDGRRITVEFARGVPRNSRDYMGRGPPPGAGRCFNCGLDGHWARDCTAGDWKNKCYRCGERGHIERHCKNSPKKLSRSPVRRGRSRSRSRSYSRGRSYSRSRSPAPAKRERSIDRDYVPRSPGLDSPPHSKRRTRSPSPDEGSPREGGSPSPKYQKRASRQDEAEYGDSPRERNGSPVAPERDDSRSPAGKQLSDANGYSPAPNSPMAADDRSPVDDDDEDRRSPRAGSESA